MREHGTLPRLSHGQPAAPQAAASTGVGPPRSPLDHLLLRKAEVELVGRPVALPPVLGDGVVGVAALQGLDALRQRGRERQRGGVSGIRSRSHSAQRQALLTMRCVHTAQMLSGCKPGFLTSPCRNSHWLSALTSLQSGCWCTSRGGCMGRCVGRCCTPLDATSAPGGQQQ